MSDIIKMVLGAVTGGATTAGGIVANVAALTALLAALAPATIYLLGHREEVFITVTLGELAFWGTIIGVLILVMVKMAHRAPPPA